ncbi:MAG: universal stress protein [Thermoleophilia bacterium]
MEGGAMTAAASGTEGVRGAVRARHVACCVDGAPGDDAAVEAARGLAGPEGRVSVVHVARRALSGLVEGEPGVEPDRDDRARSLVARAAEAVPGAEVLILHGAPGPAICRWAEVAGADVLVVASRHPGRWGMSVLGPVTRHVVDHAPCAVLVVRHGEA